MLSLFFFPLFYDLMDMEKKGGALFVLMETKR